MTSQVVPKSPKPVSVTRDEALRRVQERSKAQMLEEKGERKTQQELLNERAEEEAKKNMIKKQEEEEAKYGDPAEGAFLGRISVEVYDSTEPKWTFEAGEEGEIPWRALRTVKRLMGRAYRRHLDRIQAKERKV